MKHLLTLAWVILSTVPMVYSQQDPLYTQYINNPFVINPAYGGMTNNLNASINYRYQWTGFEGSPKSFNANGHMALADNLMGAGFLAISDQLGASTTNEFFGTYSYRLQIDKRNTLSFGLQGGISNYQTDNNKVNPQDSSDPLFQGTLSKTAPNLGAGLILSSDKYFVSLSIPRMLEASLEEDGIQASQYTRHIYAMGSYLSFLSERIRLRPSILLKYVSGSPASVDLNAVFIIHENYQVGLLTRDFNTYGFLGQVVIKDSFRFGYVFEVPTGSSVGSNFVTHEVTLGIRFNVLPFHSNNSVISF
jgi:type IX secretion system PorP/SprF family membrane protein